MTVEAINEQETVAILKGQLAEMNARVEAGYETLFAAGIQPNEPPASNIVLGCLIETLFGDDDNPQRITFDMRLAGHRLKIIEGLDIPALKAEAAKKSTAASMQGHKRARRRR